MSTVGNLEDALRILLADPTERVIVTFLDDRREHRFERALREIAPDVVTRLKEGGYPAEPAGGRLVPVDDSLLGKLVPNGARLAQTWVWRPDGTAN